MGVRRKFEYMTWCVNDDGVKTEDQLVVALNRYGQDGWQVVAFDDGHYLLMRELQEKQTAHTVDV